MAASPGTLNVSSPGADLESPVYLKGLLTDAQYELALTVIDGVTLTLSLLGILSNTINVRTFLAMGLDDGVSISFLSLAVTDLIMSLSAFATFTILAMILHQSANPGIRYPVNLYAPVHFTINVCLAVSTSTILTTMYIALARCMCVYKPLQFKSMFTRSRSIIALACINFFAVAIYIPMFSLSGLALKFNPIFNDTQVVLAIHPSRERVKDGIFILIKTILPFSGQLLLIVCVVIMAKSLVRSTKLRKSGKIGDPQKGDTVSNLPKKERQAVLQVLLISLVFLICNTPNILVSFGSMVVPGFDTRFNQYWRLYLMSHQSIRGFEQLNGCINIVFYYLYNSKYRTSLRLCCHWDTPSE